MSSQRVTELALIRLKNGYNALGDFAEIIQHCQEVQDRWVQKHQPHLLADNNGNLSSFNLQDSNPAYLLITAPWDSPEGHEEWVRSDENKEVFGKLSERIDSESDSVLLFHMTPAGMEMTLSWNLATGEPVRLWRLSIQPSQKQTAEQLYQSIATKVAIEHPDGKIWAGWRVEKTEGVEGLAVFLAGNAPQQVLDDLLSLPGTQVDHLEFHHMV